jgi:putative drug exporter of the RND superfamily
VASLLHRIGRWSAGHRWTAVLVWLLVIAVAGGSAATLMKPLGNEFSIPGSRFQVVLEQLEESIPAASGIIGTVVFSADQELTEDQRAAIGEVTTEWAELDGILEARDPFATQAELEGAADQLAQGREELETGRAEMETGREELASGRAELDVAQEELDAGRQQLEAAEGTLPPAAYEQQLAQLDAAQEELDAGREELEAAEAELAAGEEELAAAEAELEHGERMAALTEGVRQVSPDGSVAVTQVSFDSTATVDPVVADAVQEIGARLEAEGVQVDYSTEIVSDISSVMGPAEGVGLLIAAVVLLVMLGSLVAAGLPLLIAAVGVGVGLGAAMALSSVVEMTSVTPALALMLGLAVGIDYSLFILNRHRMQLADGMPLRDSIALATGTAGNAVVFAGTTVIIALVALTLTGIPFLGTMGLVAAGTVLVAVLAAVTLTPAVLSIVGQRVLSRRQRRAPRHEESKDEASTGWAAVVQRRPWLAILGVVAVAGLLASPFVQLRLGLPDGSSEPAGSTAYRTFDLIRDNFGAGTNGPIIGVATLDATPADETALTEAQLSIAEDLAEVEGVQYVVPFGVSEDQRTLAYQMVPADGPSDESTVRLVEDLEAQAGALGETHGAEIGFTGQTVANIDISAQLGEALPVYLVVVVGLSLLLLLLVFRSIWVPVLATLGFLLSVAAAFGGVVATYQLGIGSSFFGVNEPGPVLSFLPILLVGVLFGLAMDYQVFIVSAMREAYVHGADARTAVVTGFNHSARVVVAAAIIMVSVFGGFIFAELTMIRPIGFGLALGVLVDAFLVRMTLTPAVLSLLGERAWWLPRWLDRVLPDVDVEGAKLERAVAPVPQPEPVADRV